MRIVFFGTPELAVPSLAALHSQHDVVGVVCQPDRPSGRGRHPQPPPVKEWAESHGLEVVQPEKLNDGDFERWLRKHAPDLCALVAYGRILKQPILDTPRYGFLNMHPSLLPKYRGPSPIQSAILEGESETGVTIMRLSAEMDAGDVLLQQRAAIEPDDTGETLANRLAELGAKLLLEGVHLVESGEARFSPQDHVSATYCKRFEKRDGQIDWSAPAQRIHNLVRAAQPWPVAHSRFKNEIIRILKSAPVTGAPAAPPGQVLAVEPDRIIVAAGDGALALLEVQVPGKRVMPMADYLRGHAIRPGDRFESRP